jgi:hypothetical protein
MEFIQYFMELSTGLKLYHWHTELYPRHIASGDLFDKVISTMDKFIEIYQGKRGIIEGTLKIECNINKFTDSYIVQSLNRAKTSLMDLSNQLLTEEDTDLLNIRDELLGDINKTLYLFTFK